MARDTRGFSVPLNDIAPLVDDGAEYSAIGIVELKLLQHSNEISLSLDPISNSLGSVTHWQFRYGPHASASRKILGSVVLTAKVDRGNDVKIRHVVVDGSSQWVIRRNLTSKTNILYAHTNVIQF